VFEDVHAYETVVFHVLVEEVLPKEVQTIARACSAKLERLRRYLIAKILHLLCFQRKLPEDFACATADIANRRWIEAISSEKFFNLQRLPRRIFEMPIFVTL
jgi:hypothetical protein